MQAARKITTTDIRAKRLIMRQVFVERKAERLPPETQGRACTARRNCRPASSGEAGRQFVSSVWLDLRAVINKPEGKQVDDSRVVSASGRASYPAR